MTLPRSGLAVRILEPRGFRAGEADDENVDPAVSVKVIRVGEEVVRVLQLVERRAGINRMTLLELRTGEPPRTRNGIELAIVVHVTKRGALGDERLIENGFAERGHHGAR